jgi:hypothetical protein
MSRLLLAATALAFAATVSGCRATPAVQPGRYLLTPGSSISINTDDDGDNTVSVVIPPGNPGAGQHVSNELALVVPAQEAKSRMNDPGVDTVIQIDDDGDLIAIEQSMIK